MRTIEYLFDPYNSSFYWPGVITGAAFALMASVLSVFVVLKRLSFIGQGISHAAFGGMGVVAVLGIAGSAGAGASAAQFSIVLAFCVAAALGIAALTDRRSTSADTAIGIVLVASMALGAILLQIAIHQATRAAASGAQRQRTAPAWESVLFGSITSLGWADAVVALGVAAAILVTLWWVRRPLVFWAFDEAAAPAFGVRADAMRILLLVLLCLAIVTAMKLAGVVLATAILVLPGTTALALSERLDRVIAISVASGLVGVLGGLVLSFETDWPTGASIVAALTTLFAAARVWTWLRANIVRPRGSAA
jgi:zinc transport system permease protein